MLKLDNIKKEYTMADANVPALKGISIEFRKSEFVSILGQSGCGKTTLLNIIGGLDHYTSGDLIVKGISTKDFKSTDWDAYRNHTIGFVFQSYNLISHLNVLANVELALTISGISSSERKARALASLERVGLKDHVHKMPNQLSGGQMQRVAIARAIVNDPEILLADEPTGALDTATSIQIMDLIQEIAKERLVIMVTHNPELAKKYSTRIVKLLDGVVVEDSNPYDSSAEYADATLVCGVSKETTNEQGQRDNHASVENTAVNESNALADEGVGADIIVDKTDENREFSGEKERVSTDGAKRRKNKKETPFKKTSMSFFTALALSFKNLLSKKGRTLLVSIASSIGIIGVTLVLALSNGFNLYIAKLQADMLSSNPLTISENQFNYSALTSLLSDAGLDKFPTAKEIIVKDVTKKAQEIRPSVKITQDYIDNAIKTIDKKLYNDIVMTTGQRLNVYTLDIPSNKYKYINVNDSSDTQYRMLSSNTQWNVLIDNKTFLETQYDVIGGTYPQNAYELALFVDKYNQVGDNILKQLGIYDDGDTKIDFDKVIGKSFYIATNDNYYTFDSSTNAFSAGASEYESGDFDATKYIEVKISGILRPRADTQNQIYGTGVAYSKELSTLVQNANLQSEIVEFAKTNAETDPLTGKPYKYEPYYTSVSAMQEARIRELGGNTVPNYIAIYPFDFESKNAIKAHLDAYNDGKPDDQQVLYNDVMGMFMTSLTDMVNIIGYVLIAFSAISLIVSSIMIAVITYVSVIERTKEIGVLRSMGARKKDIARVFNAETFIIGLLAGIIGVGVTLLLTIPINIVIGGLAEDIGNIAVLSPIAGVVMIILSIGLTLLAGFIPSRMASKKDPVTCLRTD